MSVPGCFFIGLLVSFAKFYVCNSTAVVVSPIDLISYEGVDYKIPLDNSDPSAQAGKLTSSMFERIMDIQYGRAEHADWSKVLD